MRITCVTVDCHDPAVVAHFWSEALEWDAVAVSEGGDGTTCRPPEGGAYLEFVRVPEEKAGKNRLHLGCNAGTLADLEDELTRLQSLGATIAWGEEFPPEIAVRYRNVILRDVEGNEFCLGGGDSNGQLPYGPGAHRIILLPLPPRERAGVRGKGGFQSAPKRCCGFTGPC